MEDPLFSWYLPIYQERSGYFIATWDLFSSVMKCHPNLRQHFWRIFLSMVHCSGFCIFTASLPREKWCLLGKLRSGDFFFRGELLMVQKLPRSTCLDGGKDLVNFMGFQLPTSLNCWVGTRISNNHPLTGMFFNCQGCQVFPLFKPYPFWPKIWGALGFSGGFDGAEVGATAPGEMAAAKAPGIPFFFWCKGWSPLIMKSPVPGDSKWPFWDG